jgi:hypothetical protein
MTEQVHWAGKNVKRAEMGFIKAAIGSDVPSISSCFDFGFAILDLRFWKYCRIP